MAFEANVPGTAGRLNLCVRPETCRVPHREPRWSTWDQTKAGHLRAPGAAG